MTAPTLLLPTQAPTAIRRVKGWLLWRYVRIKGEEKPRKAPHYSVVEKLRHLVLNLDEFQVEQ